MLDFLRKFLPKTDRPAPSAAGARGGFNYSGGPLFGPWDPSVHAAPGQYARFGRAAARPLSVFSKGGERTKVLDCDAKAGAVKVQGRLDRVYTVSLDRCTCPDFQERGLPCKHIYALAAFLGYTPADYWASWLDVACADGIIPRPASGYSNGVFRYDVRGVNPETGRKNKRTVSACGEEDAVAAAREIGLADPVEVLPLDMAAQNMHPVSERQKAFAAEYQVTFAPDFDEKDAGAVLSRYDREDATGICLSFCLKNSPRVMFWPCTPPLSGFLTPVPHWWTHPRTRWTRFATPFRTPPPAPNGPANCRPANCSSRLRGPRRIGPPARFSALMRGDQALCRIALLIRFSISWSRTV